MIEAVGVEIEDGSVFKARKFIASGLNPQQTFLELIDGGSIAARMAREGAGVQI